MNKRILLIEDEQGLVITLTDRLKSEGFVVESARDGIAGYEKAKQTAFDAIILDVMLPRKNGFDVCRDLRAAGISTPVIMLTARGQVVDKVVGLRLGADDYLTKPFDATELLARLEAIMRRYQAAPPRSGEEIFQSGPVRIDFKSAIITRNEETFDLTGQEYRLLRYFVDHRGHSLSREELLEKVWNYNDDVTTRTVDVHVAWLRQKLEPDPKHPRLILTIHGVGYKFTS